MRASRISFSPSSALTNQRIPDIDEGKLKLQIRSMTLHKFTAKGLRGNGGRGKNDKVHSQDSSPRVSAKSERALRETATRFRKALRRLADR